MAGTASQVGGESMEQSSLYRWLMAPGGALSKCGDYGGGSRFCCRRVGVLMVLSVLLIWWATVPAAHGQYVPADDTEWSFVVGGFKTVSDLAVRDGEAFGAGIGGVFHRKGGVFSVAPQSPHWSSRIDVLSDGRLLVVASGRLYRYDDGEWEVLYLAERGQVYDVAVDCNHNVAIVEADGRESAMVYLDDDGEVLARTVMKELYNGIVCLGATILLYGPYGSIEMDGEGVRFHAQGRMVNDAMIAEGTLVLVAGSCEPSGMPAGGGVVLVNRRDNSQQWVPYPAAALTAVVQTPWGLMMGTSTGGAVVYRDQ